MAGILSKGITLSRKVNGGFVALTNLQEIAELGNNAPEKVDVTVLSDSEKKSIAGLTDTAQDLAFKFLYEKEQFNELAALHESTEWQVKLPDGTTAEFTATPSVKLAGVGVSAPIAYTLNLSVESLIEFGKGVPTITIDGVKYKVDGVTTWAQFAEKYSTEFNIFGPAGDMVIKIGTDPTRYVSITPNDETSEYNTNIVKNTANVEVGKTYYLVLLTLM